MTASIHYLPPGQGPARRAMQDAKTPAWIKEIAASMTGDVAPEDMTMAEPGEPRTVLPAQPMPVLDYAADDRNAAVWRADFWDGVAGACLFVALGAIGGAVAIALLALKYLQQIGV